jgi:putative nucleotidyltransferase with HDIG domain
MPEIRNQIIARISRIDNLPMQSQTIYNLQESICGHTYNEADLPRIVSIIEQDVGLSAKIVKMANSVYYNARYGDIGSIHQAVTRIGLEQIFKICLAFATMKIFPVTSQFIDLKDFWQHSISVAMVTRSIGEKAVILPVQSEYAYIAGLLHDIGILILDKYFAAIYQKLRTLRYNYTGTMYDLELEVLGIDHGEIGGMVLERWKFPQGIINAVTNHHNPDRSPLEFLPITQLVHVSDFACAAVGQFEPGESIPEQCSAGAWYDLKINEDELGKIVESVEQEVIKSNEFISMSF